MQPRLGGTVSSSSKPSGEVDGDWVQLHQQTFLLALPGEQSSAGRKRDNLVPISPGNSCPSLEVPRFGVETICLWVVTLFQ